MSEQKFRRQWRPINEFGHQEDVWTTFDESEVERARKDHPWMKFQSRLISDWANEDTPPTIPADIAQDIADEQIGEGK